MPASHLVEIAGEVEGEHHLLSCAQGMIVDHAHDGFDALVERARRTVRLQLVVFDEIDAGAAEVVDQRRSVLGTEADTRLDDGADQRPPLHAG